MRAGFLEKRQPSVRRDDLRSSTSETDEHLGFFWNSRLIALEKHVDDTRRWDFHRDFQFLHNSIVNRRPS